MSAGFVDCDVDGFFSGEVVDAQWARRVLSGFSAVLRMKRQIVARARRTMPVCQGLSWRSKASMVLIEYLWRWPVNQVNQIQCNLTPLEVKLSNCREIAPYLYCASCLRRARFLDHYHLGRQCPIPTSSSLRISFHALCPDILDTTGKTMRG